MDNRERLDKDFRATIEFMTRRGVGCSDVVRIVANIFVAALNSQPDEFSKQQLVELFERTTALALAVNDSSLTEQ